MIIAGLEGNPFEHANQVIRVAQLEQFDPYRTIIGVEPMLAGWALRGAGTKPWTLPALLFIFSLVTNMI